MEKKFLEATQKLKVLKENSNKIETLKKKYVEMLAMTVGTVNEILEEFMVRISGNENSLDNNLEADGTDTNIDIDEAYKSISKHLEQIKTKWETIKVVIENTKKTTDIEIKLIEEFKMQYDKTVMILEEWKKCKSITTDSSNFANNRLELQVQSNVTSRTTGDHNKIIQDNNNQSFANNITDDFCDAETVIGSPIKVEPLDEDNYINREQNLDGCHLQNIQTDNVHQDLNDNVKVVKGKNFIPKNKPEAMHNDLAKPSTSGINQLKSRFKGDWHRACSNLLNELWKNEDSVPFRMPYNDPEYIKRVITPMCLNDVREYLKTGHYKTAGEFHKDIRLIFRNSKEYNTNIESEIYKMTERLEKIYEKNMETMTRICRAKNVTKRVASEEEEISNRKSKHRKNSIVYTDEINS